MLLSTSSLHFYSRFHTPLCFVFLASPFKAPITSSAPYSSLHHGYSVTAVIPLFSRKDEGDKVIVFERANLLFVFNFHWHKSFTHYGVGCLKPGKYKVVLDSDERKFDGFARIDHNARFHTTEGWYDDRPHSFLVYAPCRTSVVYSLTDD